MSDQPRLSVVVPTYNRCDTLVRLLDALASQTLPSDSFEVIVVSDGSTDRSAEAVSSRTDAFRLRYLEQPNAGPSAARNRGLRAACAPISLFLDDDIEPSPVLLARHLDAHADEELLVLIGPQLAPPGEPCDIWVEWEHRMLARQYTRFVSGEWQPGPNNLYSGNFSAPRRCLIDSGGFDETFRRQEDVDLGFRLERDGLRFRFDMEAVGYHRPTRSWDSWFDSPAIYGRRDVQISRDKGETRAAELARKHYSERSWLTRALARRCVGRPAAARAAYAAMRRVMQSAAHAGLPTVAFALCSAIFNVRYLEGMAGELGGSDQLWAMLRSRGG